MSFFTELVYYDKAAVRSGYIQTNGRSCDFVDLVDKLKISQKNLKRRSYKSEK